MAQSVTIPACPILPFSRGVSDTGGGTERVTPLPACPRRAAPRLGGGHRDARGPLLHQVSGERGRERKFFCIPGMLQLFAEKGRTSPGSELCTCRCKKILLGWGGRTCRPLPRVIPQGNIPRSPGGDSCSSGMLWDGLRDVVGWAPGGSGGPWGAGLAVPAGLRLREGGSGRLQPRGAALNSSHWVVPHSLSPPFLPPGVGIGAVARRFWRLDGLGAAGCGCCRVRLLQTGSLSPLLSRLHPELFPVCSDGQ